jgi:membrane-associated phospholipid phosphatase
MLYNSPPPMFNQQDCIELSFRPGDFNQDIFTLPVEVGLISSLNYFYRPRNKTLFPIFDEDTGKKNESTTFTRSKMLPYAIGTGAFVLGGLNFINEDYQFGVQVRGFAHALLLTELASSSAKTIFQKKRPNYNEQVANNSGKDTSDSRASFFSSHASQAFAFSTYTSLLLFKYSNSTLLSSIYSLTTVAASSLISYSRVTDHAHNTTDVIIGALVGASISGLTFFRVEQVELEKKREQHLSTWKISPDFGFSSVGKIWYSANIYMEL